MVRNLWRRLTELDLKETDLNGIYNIGQRYSELNNPNIKENKKCNPKEKELH